MSLDAVKIDLDVLASPIASGAPFSLERAIPVFHRWIREGSLDELMVDVADYTHIPDGPGVLLVCHDAIYSLGRSDGELRLRYSRRRETHPALGPIAGIDDRLRSVFRRALAVCGRLEREADLAGLRFPADRFRVAINDRRVPADEAPELVAALKRLGDALSPDERPTIEVGVGTGGRLEASFHRGRAGGIGGLLGRLAPGVEAGTAP